MTLFLFQSFLVYSICILMFKFLSDMYENFWSLQVKSFWNEKFIPWYLWIKKIIQGNLLFLYLHNLVKGPLNLIPKKIMFLCRKTCIFNELSLHFILSRGFNVSLNSFLVFLIKIILAFRHFLYSFPV